MDKLQSDRMGVIRKQTTGHNCFIPNKLYPKGVKMNIDMECIKLLTEATGALGELKGATNILANPDLFIAYYVRKEALLSSQIEGTQCSLEEVLQVEERTAEVKPVQEVVNYINAMNQGLDELKKLPMSLGLINKIHKVLLSGVRGKEKIPGQYKKFQNWIGAPGCKISEATYVPPPPNMMVEFMGDWEKYYHVEKDVLTLIEAALLHSYFETIHPYADGNGRLGRLLITFMLCERKILDRPLLYLSLFFKEHKGEYYNLLMDVRLKGNLEKWIKFFLRGVRNTSLEAVKTAKEIITLHDKDFNLVKEQLSKYHRAIPLYELFCEHPIISITNATKLLKSTYPTMKQTFQKLIDLKIIELYKGDKARNKLFVYLEYLKILRRGT